MDRLVKYQNGDRIYYSEGDWVRLATVVQPISGGRIIKKTVGYLCRSHSSDKLFSITLSQVVDLVREELDRIKTDSHYWSIVEDHKRKIRELEAMVAEAGINICPACSKPVGGLDKFSADWSWHDSHTKIHDDCMLR